MSRFKPATFEEAVKNRSESPQKQRKPIARGKGLSPGSRSLGVKSTKLGCATAGRKKAKKAKKAKRKRLPSIKNLKKRVWVQFSIFIRTRDADEFGIVTCCTCPARHPWNSGEIHAGHWIHGRLDFDERNIHGQCKNDNYYSHTKVNTAYACFMAKTYGHEVMDELRLLSNTRSNKYSRDELDGLLEHYRNLNALNPLVERNL